MKGEVQKIAIVLGTHQVSLSAIRMYREQDYCVFNYKSAKLFLSSAGSGTHILDFTNLREVFFAEDIVANNNSVQDGIALLQYLYDNVKKEYIKCHFLLQDKYLFDIFRKGSFADRFKDKIEIVLFNEFTLWGEKLFSSIPEHCDNIFPLPDRSLIDYSSPKRIHIVIFGFNDMAQVIAEYAALTCHYPNYVKDHSLRTRITIVDDDVKDKCASFINTRQYLFDNSYYRYLDLISVPKEKSFHYPLYNSEREDFVDVEWEFVKGNISSPLLRKKLVMWSMTPSQSLTVFLCGNNAMENISFSQQLPKEMQDFDVPVMLRVSDKSLASALRHKNIFPFGYDEIEYDISLPLVKMAKVVNYVYNCCYEYNYLNSTVPDRIFSPVEIDYDRVERDWRKLNMIKRFSCILNAMTIGYKMRSLGITDYDWNQFYGISSKEVDILARVEHNRWSVEKLLLGFRPVTSSEQKDIEDDISYKDKLKDNNVHYDLRAYDDLRPDNTGKNVNTYDISLSMALPLIANSLNK